MCCLTFSADDGNSKFLLSVEMPKQDNYDVLIIYLSLMISPLTVLLHKITALACCFQVWSIQETGKL
jgi:hypothetical protein